MAGNSQGARKGISTSLKNAFESGQRAANKGWPRTACPYSFGGRQKPLRMQWLKGYDSVAERPDEE